MPRRIIGGAFVSMDGVMQAPGGPEEDPTGGFAHGGWLATMFDEGLGNQIDTLFAPPFDLLLGRRTYDIFAAHWPYQPADDPLAAALNKATKYVVTHSGEGLSWSGTERTAGIEAVARVREGDGPNLVIQGSSTLYPQLLEHGLLDRLVLMMAPVILGHGKRLFGEGTPSGRWKLVEHRVTASGMAMASYDPAGPVETGSFAMQDPSEAELQRRERMAGEG